MLPAVFDFLNGPVRDLVTQIYEAVGYLGVALWVAIESVIIPIPSELVLPVRRLPRRRGRGARADHRAAVELLARPSWPARSGRPSARSSPTRIGDWGGRPVLERWGRYLGITPADLDKADAFFARHGEAASFFGRMIPVIRSLVSFAAGIAHMPLGKFTLFTFLGSLPWTRAARLRRRPARRELGDDRGVPQAVRVRDHRGPRRHRARLDLAPDHQAAPARRLLARVWPRSSGGRHVDGTSRYSSRS